MSMRPPTSGWRMISPSTNRSRSTSRARATPWSIGSATPACLPLRLWRQRKNHPPRPVFRQRQPIALAIGLSGRLVETDPETILGSDWLFHQAQGHLLRDCAAVVRDTQLTGHEGHANTQARFSLALCQGVLQQILRHAVEQAAG